jgi:hypothetical protein
MLASVTSKGCAFGRREYGQLQRLVFRSALILLILRAFLVRLPLLEVRRFAPDEFQHVHTAYSIRAGLIPYRDFFEASFALGGVILGLLWAYLDRRLKILSFYTHCATMTICLLFPIG